MTIKLDKICNKDKFFSLVEQGYVCASNHPSLDLTIYKYSKTAPYNFKATKWPEELMLARGLVLNSREEVIARGFRKFFNYGEQKPPFAATNKPVIFEKVDGCLPYKTLLNLWDGGSITIGEIVNNKLDVTLIGRDSSGNIVPAFINDWHNNGVKENWFDIVLDCNSTPYRGCGGHPNRLRITGNHQVFADDKWITAKDLSTKNTLIKYRYGPDKNVFHLIRSSLLGDGSVCYEKHTKKAVYTEGHSSTQINYITWLKDKLGNCGTQRTDTISGYGSEMKWAGSKGYEVLADLRKEWYPDSTKIVPADLSWIDDFTVAKWYMDDGSLSHNSSQYQQDRAHFATNSFTYQDVNRLGNKLHELYNISFTVYQDRGWNLRINAGRDKSIENLWKGISKHVIPSLRYKLPEHWRDTYYEDYPVGTEKIEAHPVKILSIKETEFLSYELEGGKHSQNVGYDLTTTTSNFFAKGVLVHNSCLLAFRYENQYVFATLGSFQSEQALWAAKFWEENATYHFSHKETFTFIYEIIYPENRIVVNYGQRKGLIWLGYIDPDTGEDHDIRRWPNYLPPIRSNRFGNTDRTVRCYEFDSIKDALAWCDEQPAAQSEGLILCWYRKNKSAFRLKLKGQDYLKIFKILYYTSNLTLWEWLRDGKQFEELLDNFPEIMYAWANECFDTLTEQYERIEYLAVLEYTAVLYMLGEEGYDPHTSQGRKEFARLVIKRTPRWGILFKMFDDDDYSKTIWDMIRPTYSKAFITAEPEG